MCDVLLKPTTRTALEAAIRSVLGGAAAESSQINDTKKEEEAENK